MSEQPKLPTLNQWFLSLEEGRQAVLREDKWMLAENAYQAGIEAARAARTASAEPVAKVVSKFGDPEAFGERELQPLVDLGSLAYDTKLYTAPGALHAEVEQLKADAERYRWLRDGAQSSNFNGDYSEIPIGSIDCVMQWTGSLMCGLYGEELDAEIDAARTAKPEVKL